MSEEEQTESGQTQYLTAEYKDGQLQIVEMTPYETVEGEEEEDHTITNLEEVDRHTKYVIDSKEGLMKLDLLNMTLVRCNDNLESYELVSNMADMQGSETSVATISCVVQDDAEEQNQEIVMVQGEDGLVIMNSLDEAGTNTKLVEETQQNERAIKTESTTTKSNMKLSATEILEKAKQLQKTKALLAKNRIEPKQARGRKRKCDLPSPHELLASPSFKLFLYSCKQCPFKCNAIKEMTAHKQTEHPPSRKLYKMMTVGKQVTSILQCARCPFKGNNYSQLMKHVQDFHVETDNKVYLDTEEVAAADVLVCGACGFESSARDTFREHIEDEHGATTC